MKEDESSSSESNLEIDDSILDIPDMNVIEGASNTTIEAPQHEIILKDDGNWTIENIRSLTETVEIEDPEITILEEKLNQKKETLEEEEEPEIIILEEKLVKNRETIPEKVKRKFQETVKRCGLKLKIINKTKVVPISPEKDISEPVASTSRTLP